MGHLNKVSEELLLAVKKEKSFDDLLLTLASVNPSDLEKQLSDDTHKNAFWINIYNSFFQILRKHEHLKQPKIYTAKRMTIAGKPISLDDIEHGILRRFRYKYSLGYLPDIFIDTQFKKWAVSAVDFRIHFALNCGAKSCPPIAFYSAEKLEEQLELSTKAFITNETQVDQQKRTFSISRLFLWFLKDFGGPKGGKNIVEKYLEKDLSDFKKVYQPYSWDEHLDHYAEHRFDSDHN